MPLRTLLLVAASILWVDPARTAANAPDIAITDVTVVDVVAGSELPSRTVVVRGDRILAVRSASQPAPRNAMRIDGRGRWLIPGLWDMHAHTLTDHRYTYFFPLLLANGVTGIREMGSNLSLEEFARVRRDTNSGAILGPRIGAATPRLLDGPGSTQPTAVLLRTPAEARATLRAFRSAGGDFAKPYNLLSRETYFAIVGEAKKLGMPIEGHIPFAVSVLEAARLGQSTTEHDFDVLVSASRDEMRLRDERSADPAHWVVNESLAATSYDPAKARSLYKRLALLGMWSVPTIAFYRIPILIGDQPSVRQNLRLRYVPSWLVARWSAQLAQAELNMTAPQLRPTLFAMRSRIVGEMHRAGMHILAGTDSGAMFAVAGFTLHDELSDLVAAGLTPAQALRAATIEPARFLHRDKIAGSVTAGKEADLVLLDGDPLTSIHNSSRIRAVIARGRLFDRSMLDGLLETARKAAEASPDPGPPNPPSSPASFAPPSGRPSS